MRQQFHQAGFLMLKAQSRVDYRHKAGDGVGAASLDRICKYQRVSGWTSSNQDVIVSFT